MEALLSTENLSKEFKSQWFSGMRASVRALDGVTLSIKHGDRIAIVGGSGSGKSTLAACLACLERPTSGVVRFEGREVSRLSERELRQIRPQVQLVFQDSSSAFQPEFTVLEVLEEPLHLQSDLHGLERRARATQLLGTV